MSQNWIPEIMYEDDSEGLSSKIPFILVPKDNVMPKILFIFESRDTGECEPSLDGDSLPIFEMELHQYADMAILKSGLDADTYDKVRQCLDLEPLQSAQAKGKLISNNIRKNIEERLNPSV